MYFKLINIFFILSSCIGFQPNHFVSKKVTFKPKISMNLESCGMDLAIGTLVTGFTLDNTISYNSTQLVQFNNSKLFIEGYKKAFVNLLIIGPIYFSFVSNLFIRHNNVINLMEVFSIIVLHNLGYFIMHTIMHKVNIFRKYHLFHHKFREIVFPSIGNAVSPFEFTFAYMIPFITSAIIVNPSNYSYKLAIAIISFFNLIIHSEELRNINYYKFLVSPFNHTEHHKISKANTYSAPLINFDYLIENLKKINIYLADLFTHIKWGLDTYFNIRI